MWRAESGFSGFSERGGKDTYVDLWLPSSAALGQNTAFLEPSPETTLTIPSTAFRPLTVGAYDSRTGIYAPFSGRGDTRIYHAQKPDLAAPGRRDHGSEERRRI